MGDGGGEWPDAVALLGEGERPDAVRGVDLDAQGRAPGEHLRAIHDMYRAELDALLDVTRQVEAGLAEWVDLRQAIHDLSLRRQLDRYGSICARYCSMVAVHHAIEDQRIFPAVRAGATAGTGWGDVIDQLEREHAVIHRQLRAVDAAVVSVLEGAGAPASAIATIRLLADLLRSHFSYEEAQLAEPLGLLGIGL